MKTASEISTLAENKFGLAERRLINKLYRNQDESHLWPINNRFNATDRAIRNIRRFERNSGYSLSGLEYCYAVDDEISRIVNGAY